MNRLSGRCPYCYGKMEIERLRCTSCKVAIEGKFPISRLSQLNTEQQRFIELFVLSSGSLKEMAQKLNVSYPTVRNRLDRVIEALEGKMKPLEEQKGQILDAVEEGKLSAEEAADLIKQL
ncbi:unnamed protein product [marine sediment metagenome]|uniref:DUF2089 domain-containing protein n=1 Tax=marine sediment metagenome TaxID=412755 RepID=X1B3F6_9ZZZZ